MNQPLAGITQGLEIAGILQALILTGYVLLWQADRRLALVPASYLLAVAALFLQPLLGSLGAGPGAVPVEALRLAVMCLPALAFLLVHQLVGGQLPRRRDLVVLCLPALATPLGWSAEAPLRQVAEVVVAGLVLLLLVVSIRPRMRALAGRPMGPELRALILTIVFMQTLLSGIGLMALSGGLAPGEARFITAAIGLTALYLVASSVFRVFPAAFAAAPALDPATTASEAPSAPTAPDAEAAVEGAGPADRADEEESGEDLGDPAADGGNRAVAEGDAELAPATAPEPLSVAEQALLDRLLVLLRADGLYRSPGLSRREMAERLGVPEHHVTRVVNAGLGISFTELVNQHRVEAACDLLGGGALPVTTIAFDVGFNSLASFNRVFKQMTGSSPSQWRDQARRKAS